jgi:hypothetical protein
MAVRTALYQFVVSCTALYYPLAYVLAHTSTYHLVPLGSGTRALYQGYRIPEPMPSPSVPNSKARAFRIGVHHWQGGSS